MKIKGKVVYQHLGTGFWGIETEKGEQYRPINMPEQLKHEGKTVSVKAKKAKEDMSIFMWGTPVEIVSFETIGS